MQKDRKSLNVMGRNTKRIAALALSAGGALLWGCEADSFLDPSVVGRWEQTPTIVPVLDRLASVEGPVAEGVESSQIRAEDLIPEVEAYRIGAGDGVVISINDLFVEGREEKFEREVDSRGMIDLPLAKITLNLDGQTPEQATARISQALKDAQVLTNAVVSVQVVQRRRATFYMVGGVQTPGLYQIPKPDYRLLQALAMAGRFSEQAQSVYVIRQIPLSDAVTGRGRGESAIPAPLGATDSPAPAPAGGGAKMVDLIDELTKPAGAPSATPAPSPAPGTTPVPGTTPPPAAPAQPKIDLIDEKPAKPATPAKPVGQSGTIGGSETLANSRWKFENGQWVAGRISATATQAGGESPVTAGSDLVTQRVIEVPLAPLLAGSARYNVVIRPGDIVRIPAPNEGLVYVGGQVLRPGVFQLPQVGKLTLHRAITSAGGLASAAIPERVEIIRMLGPDRQAMVRVNLRAIAEGTQPDIVLKADDMVNVGSNFWAVPLAVIRNGFRASYGFGFILDRNFGFDVFGPQNQGGSGGF